MMVIDPKVKNVNVEIRLSVLSEFREAVMQAGMTFTQAVEEAYRLFIEKHKDGAPL